VLDGADKSVDNILKKAIGTSGPNTYVIAPGETPPLLGKKALEKPSAISKQQEKKLTKNKSSTPPTAGKKALKKPSSAISKQQEKKIAENKNSKMPTRKRSERNTKKNPWTMTNPNYNFGDIILKDDDLNVAAPYTRDLHTFFMQCCKAENNSLIMVALRPGTSWWPKREELSNGLKQIHVRLSDLYNLFKLDALDLTLIRCFIL
jgi:hypothetical protein